MSPLEGFGTLHLVAISFTLQMAAVLSLLFPLSICFSVPGFPRLPLYSIIYTGFTQYGSSFILVLKPIFPLCFQFRTFDSFSVFMPLVPHLNFVSLAHVIILLLTFFGSLTKTLNKCTICYNFFFNFPFF